MNFKNDLSYYVLKFQKNRFDRKELLKKLAPLILKIPPTKGYYDEDLKYDFFLFIASKIDKLLSPYKIKKDSNFEAWFFVVLSRQFFEFLNQSKWKIEENNNLIFLLEKNSFFSEELDFCTTNKKLTFDYSFLTKREKEVLSLKYGVSFEKINNEETKKVIIKKIEKLKKLEEKLKKYQAQLIKLQMKLSNVADNNEKNRLISKERKIKLFRDKTIEIMNSTSIFPENKWVAKKLGISEGAVATLIYRIKQKIKMKYKKEFT